MQQRENLNSALPWRDLVLRSPVNWTGVGFFVLLGSVHLGVAAAAFLHQRWEAMLSVVFVPIFFGLAIAALRFKFEVGLYPNQRFVRVCHKLGWLEHSRLIPFSLVTRVRVTCCGSDPELTRVELVCVDGHDVETPTTRIPNQIALYFALALGVPMEKISGSGLAVEEVAERAEVPELRFHSILQ